MAVPGHEPRHSLETSSDSGSLATVGIPHATPILPLKKWQHHGLKLGLLSSNYSGFLEPPRLSLIHDPPPLASGLAYFFLSSVQDILGSPLFCHSMTENKFSYPTRKERMVVWEVGKSFRKCCVRFFLPSFKKDVLQKASEISCYEVLDHLVWYLCHPAQRTLVCPQNSL